MSAHLFAVAALAALASTTSLAWVTRPADRAAVRLARNLNSGHALAAVALAGLTAISYSVYVGSVVILAMYLLVRILKAWCEWRSGGVTAAGLVLALVASFAGSLAILTRLG